MPAKIVTGNDLLSSRTCPANGVIGALHDRMPVILTEKDWPKWLGEEPATSEELKALLIPAPDENLKVWKVDKRVGNVKNNGPRTRRSDF